MSWITDQLLLGVLGLLFLVEQFRLLRGDENLFHQCGNRSWEECPVLLGNSQVRIVWLPLWPTARVVLSGKQAPTPPSSNPIMAKGDDLPDPVEVSDVLAFVEEWERQGQWLARAATGLAISLALFLFQWVGRVDVGIPFPVGWGLGLTVGFWWGTAALYGHAAKALDATSGSVRRRHMVELLISPLSALKSYSLLGTSGLTKKQPLAVTWALTPLPTLHQWVRDLCQFPDGTEGWTFVPSGDSANDLGRLCDILRRRETSLTAALSAPRRDADAICYCPRCHDQFTRSTATCPSCETITCRSFSHEENRPSSAIDLSENMGAVSPG